MIIAVTEDDIRRGQRGSATAGPVALAIRRHLPGQRVVVNNRIYVGGQRCYVPLSVSTFVRRFNFGRRVRPFRFRLVPLPMRQSASAAGTVGPLVLGLDNTPRL